MQKQNTQNNTSKVDDNLLSKEEIVINDVREMAQKIKILESNNSIYYEIIKRYYLNDFINDIELNIDEMFVLEDGESGKTVRLVDFKDLSVDTLPRQSDKFIKKSKEKNTDRFTIYTDGACEPNPGEGTCGFVVVYNDESIHEEVYQEKGITTNNRMEMKAVIMALKYVLHNNIDPENVVIKSDSTYCVNGINTWIHKWIKKNKITEFKNMDLWMEMKSLQDELKVTIQWVRGHAGNKWNEYIDNLIK